MKLELKHLAPYLPYGLKMVVKNDNSTQKWILGTENIRHAIEWWKPILRPLNDALTHKVFSGDPQEGDINDLFIDSSGRLSMDFEVGGSTASWDILSIQKYMQIYFENHFDVFGLIDAGLAIDINTIK